MLFRQLFEPLASIYTYSLGCEKTGQTVVVSSVLVAVSP